MPLPTLFIAGSLNHKNPAVREELANTVPLDYIKGWIDQRLARTGISNRVLILKSETASGKSTALPPELFKDFINGKIRKGIVCTQPRVLTTIMNVGEILKNYGNMLKLGDNIGWKTKYNKLRPVKSGGILSTTIGTFGMYLKIMSDDEIMTRYKFIMIDEVHERSLQSDVVFFMLKSFLARCADKPECPMVILMSATFEPEKYMRYFGVGDENFIWCSGQAVGRDEMWSWNNDRVVNNWPQAAADICRNICVRDGISDEEERGDILIFVPGKKEYKQCRQWLERVLPDLTPDRTFSILWIDSDAQRNETMDFRRIAQPLASQVNTIRGKEYVPKRRVIISTNVAETGVTLESLKYVIDSGFNKEIEFNPIYGIRALMTKPAPQSRIIQRMGRAGRKFRGAFYPLYPKYVYDLMPRDQFPQIITDDFSQIMLELAYEQLRQKMLTAEYGRTDQIEFRPEDLDLVDMPSMDSIRYSMEKLYLLGFFTPVAPMFHTLYPGGISPWEHKLILQREPQTSRRFGITRLGHVAVRFSGLPIESIRMILAGFSYQASVTDLITIAVMLSVDKIALAGKRINMREVYAIGLPPFMIGASTYYKLRMIIACDFIDLLIIFIALRNQMTRFMIENPPDAIDRVEAWCTLNNINFRAMMEVVARRDELLEQLYADDINVYAYAENSFDLAQPETIMSIISAIKFSIYDGYRMNMLYAVGKKKSQGEDQDIHSGYYTANGLGVTPPNIFIDDFKISENMHWKFLLDLRPRWIIYHEMSLGYSEKTDLYKPQFDKISVMDGFVPVDVEFNGAPPVSDS